MIEKDAHMKERLHMGIPAWMLFHPVVSGLHDLQIIGKPHVVKLFQVAVPIRLNVQVSCQETRLRLFGIGGDRRFQF